MATKKGKSKKAVKAKGKKTAVKAKGGEGKARDTIANFIRDQLAKDVEPAKIVEKAKEAFPKKKPTVGYVNWIREHAPKVSTTTQADA